MNIQECSPLKARWIFKWRPVKNLAIAAVIFGGIFSFVFFAFNTVIVGLVALVVAAVVYFYLDSRVIFIKCPECHEGIDTSTPWQCGFKKCRNENVEEFPFIHECESCHYVPKAYQCHHCGELIYLTPDKQQIHAAKCLAAPVAPKPIKTKTVTVVIDPTQDKELMRKHKIGDLQHELEAETLRKRIKEVKKTSRTEKTQNPEVVLIKDKFRRAVEKGVAFKDAQNEELEKMRAKYADQPEKLQEMEKIVLQAAFEIGEGQ